jgi:hypothetical protein
MTTIEFSIGDELLDAITEAGRTKAIPMTFTDDLGSQVLNQPIDEEIEVPEKGPPLRLVR